MTGSVASHTFLQETIQLFPVGGFVHIDKIDYHDAAHIPQPKLTGNFFCCFLVYKERIIFLIFFVGNSVSAIDVDDVEGFGVFNHQISTALQVYSFAERRLNLLFNSKVVENKFFYYIESDYYFQIRTDLLNI